MTQAESLTYTISQSSGVQYFTLKTGDQILYDKDKKEYYFFKFRDDPKNHYSWIPVELRKHTGTYESHFLKIYYYFYPNEKPTIVSTENFKNAGLFHFKDGSELSLNNADGTPKSGGASASSSGSGGSSSSGSGGSLKAFADGAFTDPKKMIIIGGAVVFAIALAWSIIKG